MVEWFAKLPHVGEVQGSVPAISKLFSGESAILVFMQCRHTQKMNNKINLSSADLTKLKYAKSSENRAVVVV